MKGNLGNDIIEQLKRENTELRTQQEYEIKCLKLKIHNLTKTKEQIVTAIEKKIGKKLATVSRLNYEDLYILESYILGDGK